MRRDVLMRGDALIRRDVILMRCFPDKSFTSERKCTPDE